MTDLVSLDTSKATSSKAWDDGLNTYILFNYPDLKEYDVIKRSKTVMINNKTMLPIAVRSHQETLGKVQLSFAWRGLFGIHECRDENFFNSVMLVSHVY